MLRLMKASEVIAKLSALIEEFGDLPVVSRHEFPVSDVWYIADVEGLVGGHGFCVDDDPPPGVMRTPRCRF